MKTCRDCKRPQPEDAFPVDRSKTSQRRPYCRSCAAKRTRQYQDRLRADPERFERARERNRIRCRERYYRNLDRSRCEAREASRAKGFEERKAHNLWQRFEITLDEYNHKWANQNGVCAICKQPETATDRGRVRMLAVDHNHLTGAIRDLLCGDCNKGIGSFRENIALLQAAIDYLRRHGEAA